MKTQWQVWIPLYTLNIYHFVVQFLHSYSISDKLDLDKFMCAHIDSREWFSNIYSYFKSRNFPNDTDKNVISEFKMV